MLAERFEPEHPLLVRLLALSGILAALTLVTFLLGKDVWAGFLAIYSVLAFLLWVVGNSSLLVLKYSSQLARRRNQM
jgi:hypothetical protein